MAGLVLDDKVDQDRLVPFSIFLKTLRLNLVYIAQFIAERLNW